MMATLSIFLSSSAPLKNPSKSPKPTSRSADSDQAGLSSLKTTQKLKKFTHFSHSLSKAQLSVTGTELFLSLPCLASESYVSSHETASGKIDLESIVVSIDDFFNKNPFFVAGCTFIWLVVIPVVKFYLSKCKPISAVDAFRKLKNEPNAQLLDIRDEKTLVSLASPNLKVFDKSTVHAQFDEENELRFVKKVKEVFSDPENTVVCVLDNFDGNSLKVAELLFKNDFKEAYAIKGGVRGRDGWLAIQENLLPPSVHILPKKKAKTSQKLGVNGAANQQATSKIASSGDSSAQSQVTDKEQTEDGMESARDVKTSSTPSSPYPNYPDMKPPSSPTPSKP